MRQDRRTREPRPHRQHLSWVEDRPTVAVRHAAASVSTRTVATHDHGRGDGHAIRRPTLRRPVDGGPGAARQDARRRHPVTTSATRRPVERLRATPAPGPLRPVVGGHPGVAGRPGFGGRPRVVVPPPARRAVRPPTWLPVARRLVVLAVLALAVLVFLLGRPVEAESASHEVVPVAVLVEPGDTLWGIARSVAGPDEDVRAVVARIQEMNDLRGGLRAGTVIVVPVVAGER